MRRARALEWPRTVTEGSAWRTAGHSRWRELALAVLLACGFILLQVLIGGRRPLFAYAGYLIVGLTGALACLAWPKEGKKADGACLGATTLLFLYLLGRNLVSEVPYFARIDFYCVLAAMVVYGLSVTALSHAKARITILALLLVFALLHVLVGLVQFTAGNNFMPLAALQRVDYGPRASGFYVCPNHLAGLLEVLGGFALSFAWWSRWPVWGKLLMGYLAAVCFAGVVLTGSRGGYVSAVAGVGAFLLLSLLVAPGTDRRSFLRQSALGVGAVCVALALAGAVLYNSSYLQERAGNIIDRKNMRLELWRAAVLQWEMRPFLGTGGGTYRFYGRQFRAVEVQNDPVDVHNDYLHLLAEYGIVGFAGFLLFLAVHVRRGVKGFRHFAESAKQSGMRPLSNRLALNIGALCALAAYLVHSALDFNLHIPANALLMAFVFGMLANPDIRVPAPKHNFSAAWWPRLAVGLASLGILVQGVRLLPGEYFSERARISLRDEDPAAAINFGRKALKYEQGNPELYFYLGRALLASGNLQSSAEARRADYQGAVESFLHAKKLAPLDGAYALNAAYTLDQLGEFAAAEEMYGAARERDPRALAVTELYNYHLYQWSQL